MPKVKYYLGFKLDHSTICIERKLLQVAPHKWVEWPTGCIVDVMTVFRGLHSYELGAASMYLNKFLYGIAIAN